MKRIISVLAVGLVAALPAFGTMHTKTNTANLVLSNVCDGTFSDFKFQVSGYDDNVFEFSYDDLGTDLAYTFRLTRPMDGTIYLDTPATKTRGVTTYALKAFVDLARTNLPPPGAYYGELISFDASSTNYYRSVAQGKVNVTWSLYLNESNFFARATNSAGVGQVYVHPNWRDPPWLGTNAGLGSVYATLVMHYGLSNWTDAINSKLNTASNYFEAQDVLLKAATNDLNLGKLSLSGGTMTGNINLGGQTASNGSFVGDGSGLTGIVAVTTQALWGSISGNLTSQTDLINYYTDTVAKADAAYPSSNPSNFVDATITNDLSGRVDVLSTSKVDYTDSTYTDTVAKAAAAYPSSNPSNFVDATITNDLNDVVGTKVTTNDTRQLDFTGADILIADATKTNQPVTKSQLDANIGTTNASGINVAFTPTNYTPDGASVEGHLIGIDAVVSSGSGFPLTNHGNLAGFNLTNGGLVQAVSGEFENVEMWTNSTIAPTGAVYAPLASFMSVSNSVGILITNTATAAQGTKADAAMPAPAGAIVGDMLRFNGTNWTAIPETVLIADRTIYFSSAQTVSEMQSAIDSVPRNLNGYNLYLAFSNGTYSLTDTLYVKNFKNGSTIFCTTSLTYSTLTVPYTNQPVKIQNNGLHTPVVRFDNCDDLKIYDINFHYANTYTNKIAVTTVGCSVAPFACMFSGVTTTAVNNIIGLVAQRSTFDMRACQFNNVKYGFQNSAAGIASIQASASGPVKPIADIFSATAVTMLNQTGLVTSVAAGGIVVNVAGATLP